MKYFNLLLAVYLLLAGCSQETTDRQTAVDDLAEKVIAEKVEQKKQAEQESPKEQVESVGQTRAERVIEAYLVSTSAKDRARFVLDPKTALPRMEKYYSDVNLSGVEVDEINRIDGERDPKPGKYGKYKADWLSDGRRRTSTIYYVKNARDGVRIDWEASIGFNEMSWAAFQAVKPTDPTTFRVEARLDDYYPLFGSRFTASTHFSIHLYPFPDWGYVRKNSPTGKRIFEILKDGEEHNLTLKVRFLPNTYGGNIVIDEMVSEDWLIR